METKIKYFSEAFDTIEAAQEDSDAKGLFESFGVFKTLDGKYVWANLRFEQWSRAELMAAYEGVFRATGYEMVSYTNPLIGWMKYR